MSLDYNLSKIDNWESLCKTEDGGLSSQTEGLIWATLVVDMGAITEKNWTKFANRIKAHESLYGGDKLIPRNENVSLDYIVQRHIGLTTNVATTTAAAYKKKLARIAIDRIPRDIREGL